jgi:hypothetical protein
MISLFVIVKLYAIHPPVSTKGPEKKCKTLVQAGVQKKGEGQRPLSRM